MGQYSISFNTRSQSLEGKSEDFPIITRLVSHPRFKGRKFRYSTGEPIHTKLWDKKKKRIKTDLVESAVPREASSYFRPATHKDGTEIKAGYKINGVVVQGTVLQALDQKLKDLERKIEVWLDHNTLKHTLSGKELKSYLDADKPIKGVDQIDVYKKWEEIIDATQTKDKDQIQDGTKRAKKATLTRVKEYFGKKAITFESFNQEFYDGFMKWMVKGDSEQDPPRKPMLKNTRGKHIKEVKSVLRKAMKWGLPVSPAFLDNDEFRTVKEDTDEIFLEDSDLLKLLKLKLPKHLERVRDTFVAACYTGARFGDWHEINITNITEVDGVEFLKYKSSKTGIECAVQLHNVTRLLLNKYEGDFNGGLPIISNQKTNAALKTIAGLAKLGGKIAKIKTHTARRTYCTRGVMKGMKYSDIMNASGHQSEEIFKKYVRLDALQKAISISKNDQSSFHKVGEDVLMEISKKSAS